jgi:hypothetical protein
MHTIAAKLFGDSYEWYTVATPSQARERLALKGADRVTV